MAEGSASFAGVSGKRMVKECGPGLVKRFGRTVKKEGRQGKRFVPAEAKRFGLAVLRPKRLGLAALKITEPPGEALPSAVFR